MRRRWVYYCDGGRRTRLRGRCSLTSPLSCGSHSLQAGIWLWCAPLESLGGYGCGGGKCGVVGGSHAGFPFMCSSDALNSRSPAALVSYRPDSPSISLCRSSSMQPRNSRVIHLSPADNMSESLPLSGFLFLFIYLRKRMAKAATV